MMPLGDDNSLRKNTPVVTYVLIALNILIFFLEVSGGEEFIMRWSFVPKRFLSNPVGNIPTLFTSMFMHAGFAHLFGNMLYLWIFGDNVEDGYGRIKFFIFYILCGLGATFSQLFFSQASELPNLGASGAIAGVLGAYMLMYPNSKVNVMVGRGVTQMSAWLVIGFWFLLQFLGGFSSLSNEQDVGGVAYMAHIGGFVAGLAMAFLFQVTSRKSE